MFGGGRCKTTNGISLGFFARFIWPGVYQTRGAPRPAHDLSRFYPTTDVVRHVGEDVGSPGQDVVLERMISVDAPRSFTNGKGAVPPCPFRGADRERGFSSTVVSAALAVRLRGYAGQMGCWF